MVHWPSPIEKENLSLICNPIHMGFTAQVAIEHDFYIYMSIHCYQANEFSDPDCL